MTLGVCFLCVCLFVCYFGVHPTSLQKGCETAGQRHVKTMWRKQRNQNSKPGPTEGGEVNERTETDCRIWLRDVWQPSKKRNMANYVVLIIRKKSKGTYVFLGT